MYNAINNTPLKYIDNFLLFLFFIWVSLDLKQEAIFHGGGYLWLFMDHGYLHLLACIYSMIIVIYKFIDK